MKKTLILPALLALLAMVGVTACDENDTSNSGNAGGGVYHDHKYEGYEIDGDIHYQKCTYLNCTYETAKTNHVYDQEVYIPAAFKSEATCESPAIFYKSCVCGTISTTETFEYGTPLQHSGAGNYQSNATDHWKVCDCGEIHGKEAHSLVSKEDVVSCIVDGGKYQECIECGWKTPIEERENYVPALGHQLSSETTLASFPSNSSKGIITLKCLREGCKIPVRVDLPYATEDYYTFALEGSNISATLKPEVIAELVEQYPNIDDLSERLTDKAFVTSAASVGYPYTFEVNGKQVLPSVPTEQDTANNHLSVILALKAGEQLKVYKDGNLISFVETQWGTIASGDTYTSTSSSVMKLHLSKDGGLYGEVISVLPYDKYTIKVDGVENTEALVDATGTDFARFELELQEGQVVTFYGDGNALSGGVVSNAEEGYKAYSSGTHTFYINNLNQVYVTAPDLEQSIEVTYYYYNNLGWEKVNCYSWYNMGGSSGTLTAGWPGTAMEPVADKAGWYTLTVDLSSPATDVNVIFNDGTTQTADILVFTDVKEVADGYYYFGKSTTAYDSFEAVEAAVDGYVPPVTNDMTVYFVNSKDWTTVNAYVWGDSEKVSWPGEAMTLVGSYEGKDVYSYTFPNSYVNIIFNNGSEQTVDIPLSTLGSNNAFMLSSKSDKWSVTTWLYETGEEPAPNPGDSSSEQPSQDPSEEPTPTPDPEEGFVVYYYNSNSWTSVYAYTWETGKDGAVAWPGTAMTAVDGKTNWYSFTIDAESLTGYNIIFNDGSGIQTADIALDASNLFFFGTKSTAYSSFEEVERIAAETPVIVYDWYVRGTMNNWTGNEETGLTKNGEEYVITLTLEAGAELKFTPSASNWDVSLGISNVEADCKNLVSGSDNIVINEAGTYTFYVKPATNTIWISKAE